MRRNTLIYVYLSIDQGEHLEQSTFAKYKDTRSLFSLFVSNNYTYI